MKTHRAILLMAILFILIACFLTIIFTRVYVAEATVMLGVASERSNATLPMNSTFSGAFTIERIRHTNILKIMTTSASTASEASHRLDSALGFVEQVLSPNTMQVMERSAEPKIYIGWANVTWVFIISLAAILTSLMAVSLSRGASNTII